jgi:nucleotide-binding universal stress UspA family protein
MPPGGSAHKAHRDSTLVVDASLKVAQFLVDCARRCSEAQVECQVRQEAGPPAERILLEAQQSDLILLGQRTYFHFETQKQPDETLHTVVRQSPRPVVAVPATLLPEGGSVVVAYDGSLHATRALQMFQTVGLDLSCDVHVVCVDSQQGRAARCAEYAVAYLKAHNIKAQPYALATSASPAGAILEQAHKLQATLIVMGAYGRSALREFTGVSLTHTLLQESPVPLFLYR